MDIQRPRIHFLPPANWMNDPNGLIHWQGTHHLFYQHNPNAAFWGNMHWGHAASTDLVHWHYLPLALAPTSGGPDQGGVWSGCAVDWDGVPALVYTARDGEKESVCLATSRDGLLTWEKYAGNPVIAGPPSGLDTLGFRDPYVWREGGEWMMVIGSGINGVGGTVLLYRSVNLTDWEYLGPIITGDLNETEPIWTGEMWECPNFFRLGNQWLLLISAMDSHPPRSLYTLYFAGDFDGRQFTPRNLGKMDGGDVAFYAPQVYQDALGRRITFGWAREARTVEESVAAGWAGVMSLPRRLGLSENGILLSSPVEEVEALRGETKLMENLSLPAHGPAQQVLPVEGLFGDLLELEVIIDQGEADEVAAGLLVRRSPGAEEQTEIRYEWFSKRLVVDTMRSSLAGNLDPDVYAVPLQLGEGERLRLRVILDQSILEVFANDRAAITARMYPSRKDSLGVALFAVGAPVKVERLRSWEIHPAA